MKNIKEFINILNELKNAAEVLIKVINSLEDIIE